MTRIRVQVGDRVRPLAFGAKRPEPLLSSAGTRWSGVQMELHRVTAQRHLGPAGPVDGEHGLMVVVSGALEVEVRRGSRFDTRCMERGAVSYVSGVHRPDVYEIRGEAVVATIRITPEWFHRLGLEGPPETFGLTDPSHEGGQLAALVDAMCEEIEAEAPHGSVYAESLSLALLSRVMLRVTDRERTVAGGLTGAQARTLRDYVQAHLGQEISLEMLAKLVYLSPRRMSTLFQRTFDMSPYQYVLHQRVAAAAKLLEARELTVTEIAGELGFSSTGHLSRTFRKVTGITPREHVRRQCGRLAR